MKKVIKKYGNAFVIRLDKEDMEIYNLGEGDVVELKELVVIEKKKK